MPEIVFSSSIEIKDIINLASSYKERIRLHNISEGLSGHLLDASNIPEESALYYALVIISKTPIKRLQHSYESLINSYESLINSYESPINLL